MALPMRLRCTGRGAAAWTRPCIQRSTEHTRGSGTPGEPATVVSVPSTVRKGAGTSRSVPARRAVSQSSSEPIAAAGSTLRPCRAGRCTRSRNRSRPSGAVASTRNVVFPSSAINRSSGSARGYASSARTATRRMRATRWRLENMAPPSHPGTAPGNGRYHPRAATACPASAVTANVCPVCSDAAVAVDGSPEPV